MQTSSLKTGITGDCQTRGILSRKRPSKPPATRQRWGCESGCGLKCRWPGWNPLPRPEPRGQCPSLQPVPALRPPFSESASHQRFTPGWRRETQNDSRQGAKTQKNEEAPAFLAPLRLGVRPLPVCHEAKPRRRRSGALPFPPHALRALRGSKIWLPEADKECPRSFLSLISHPPSTPPPPAVSLLRNLQNLRTF